MKTVQGQFATRELAQKAVEALKTAGVPAEQIRVWNIIPEGPPGSRGGGAQASGAVTGALLGGLGGLFVGAAVGGLIDSAGAKGPQNFPPSGVRVVVDLTPNGPEPAAILRENGAVNVA